MLTNLEKVRKEKEVTLNQIGRLLGVRYQTVSEKIKGSTTFGFDEALLVKDTFFPEYDLIYLFSTNPDSVNN
ncbi:helix-turn-helix domain-containing protein [Latilactobacillus sp. 5-91]|uniref:helix-turn-helix domain-containing protein n=1 Tax=Latilactobacillus sp. 5-91 TaxID=3410924 RepID=UPI003C73CF9B